MLGGGDVIGRGFQVALLPIGGRAVFLLYGKTGKTFRDQQPHVTSACQRCFKIEKT